MRARGAVVLVVALSLVAGACGGGGDDLDVSSPSTEATTSTTEDDQSTSTTERDLPAASEPPAPGTNAGVEGALRLGDSARVANGTVGASGGEVAIERGPLTGLEIDVPGGAFASSTPFDITLTEIRSDTFGAAITPLTPLITVENGGGYSEELLTVSIPVRVPEGSFAMGFLYDGGELEALPLVEIAPDHVTVATRHFSSFFVSAIEYALLPDDVGTGYRVQEDNWQFVNRGTYPRPGGICTGMSLTSIWYFLERKATEGKLWNRWDDDGRGDTPGFWFDDAYALRWATKAQTLMDWGANIRTFAWNRRTGWARLQYDAFRYALYVTGEPQLLEMWDANSSSGHAMVVYAQTPGSLWIADPNYPKDLRQVKFDDDTGEFKPYSSGTDAEAIAQGNDVSYVQFILTAKSSVFDWSSLGGLYQSMQAGIVGAGVFPPYQLLVRTQLDDGSYFIEPLQSGYLTSLPAITLGVSPTVDAMVYVFDGTSEEAMRVFNANATPAFTSVPLGIGANDIGIALMGGPNSAAPRKWLDFRRLTLYRDEAVTTTIPPTTLPPATAPPTTAPRVWDCTGLTGIALIECSLHNEQIGG